MSDVIWATDGIEPPAPSKNRSKRRRNWKVLTACFFTSVCSICCVVFMWISLNKIEQIKNEFLAISQKGKLKNVTSATQTESLKETNHNISESGKHQQENGNLQNRKELCGKGSGCKRLPQVMKNKMRIEASDIPLDVPIQQSMISAVHFVPMGVTQTSIRREFVNNAMCVSKWNGIICRNNTFKNHDPLKSYKKHLWWRKTVAYLRKDLRCISYVTKPPNSNQITEFWQTAPWTKTHSGDVLSFEVNPSTPGIYQAKKGGLYLLYLNVLISATYSKHDVGIFISDSKKLICRENLDYVRHASSQSASPKGKTCSISGVFYIEQNKTISVKIVTINTAIYLDSYNTNFGAVLLATLT